MEVGVRGQVIKKLSILFIVLLMATTSYGAPPQRSYSYVSGQSISPTEVSANEDSIYTYLNAGVDKYKANSITGTDLISTLAITSSGTMTFSGTTNLTTLQLGGTTITSNAAEINLIDGLSAQASELNILDGATLSTTELNYVDNVTSSIQTQINNLLPSGVIVMWSGTVATIPTGWALCNGANGTPNLTDKFIMGAGNTYNPADTGGSATHTHTGASHTHTGASHTHTGASHTHTVPMDGWGHQTATYPSGRLQTSDGAQNGYSSMDAANDTTSGAGGTGATGAGGTGATGADGTGATSSTSTLPPFYSLAYIMKL